MLLTYTICRRCTSTRVGLDVSAQQPHQNLLAAESQVSLAFSFSTLARSRTRPSVAAKKSLWAPQGVPKIRFVSASLHRLFVTRKESRQIWELRFARAPLVFYISEGPILGPSGRQFNGKRTEN